ncbi:MAG TPA: hypothetical protein VGY51_09970 [Acidimicrobiales bacterium]|jgi:hypothetical protein|nr:hypothetical protein [Acidimicrobiales bacterium]
MIGQRQPDGRRTVGAVAEIERGITVIQQARQKLHQILAED